jgi:guanylate kinase
VKLGILFYGPPAAGKDTITEMLIGRDPRYRLFRRLKVGAGRTTGYRMTTQQEVAELQESGDILWENRRYNARYFVDRTHLARELSCGWPILHLGQPDAIAAIKSAFPEVDWLTVYLWCPREVAEQRAAARGTGDLTERMEAWDATAAIRGAHFIDTSMVLPSDAAAHIDVLVRRSRPSLLK